MLTPPRSYAGRIGPLLALLALGCAILLPWAGRPLVSREQELRVVLTAKDMAGGGSWLLPRYLGEPRFNKPPLMYWAVASAFKIAGTTQSPSVARLPAAIAGIALLLVIYYGGRHLVGRRAAFAGAVAAGTTILFTRSGRLCETDIPFALFVTSAIFSLLASLSARSWKWLVISGLLSGVAFMIKGPAALFLPLAAAISAAGLRPSARVVMKGWRILPWLLLCAAVAAPWYLAVLRLSGSAAAADMGREVDALVNHSGHPGPWFFYLYTLPVVMLPWGLFLPFAAWRGWRLAHSHPGIRLLLGWFASSLILMSLIRSKQPHYATLLLAPSSLLIGVFISSGIRRWRCARLTKVALCVLPCAMVAAAWFYSAVYHERVEPARLIKDAAAEIRALRGPQTTVFMAGRRLNSMQYYADGPIIRVKDPGEGFARACPGDIVVLSRNESDPIPVSLPDPTDTFRQFGHEITLYLVHATALPAAD